MTRGGGRESGRSALPSAEGRTSTSAAANPAALICRKRHPHLHLGYEVRWQERIRELEAEVAELERLLGGGLTEEEWWETANAFHEARNEARP